MKISKTMLAVRVSLVFVTADAHSKCRHIRDVYKDSSCCGDEAKIVDYQVVPMPNWNGNNIAGMNRCENKTPSWTDVNCSMSESYEGEDLSNMTILEPFWKRGMCAVNVHWHVGAEHKSPGQFDEKSKSGPMVNTSSGFRCYHFDPLNVKFTTPYPWKYCSNMVVGETYEVQWPHSCLGACGTKDQYQSPYSDGLFCRHDGGQLLPQAIADCVGVQAQVFTIVNDESYYFPDLVRGMIVAGNMGKNLSRYTTKRKSKENEFCLDFSPITWQVDRECHLISASSFDKLCADMLREHDDMSQDTRPHPARVRTTTTTTLAPDPCTEGFHAGGLTRGNLIEAGKQVGTLTTLQHFVLKFSLILRANPEEEENIFQITENDAVGNRSRSPGCFINKLRQLVCYLKTIESDDQGLVVVCDDALQLNIKKDFEFVRFEQGGVNANTWISTPENSQCGTMWEGKIEHGFVGKVITGMSKKVPEVELFDMTYCVTDPESYG